jgi:hypothetical protein
MVRKRSQLALQKLLHKKTSIGVSPVFKRLVELPKRYQNAGLHKHHKQEDPKAQSRGRQLKMQSLQSQFKV